MKTSPAPSLVHRTARSITNRSGRSLRNLTVAIASVGLAASSSVRAADVSWNPPGGGSVTWSVGGNWEGGSAPTDDLTSDIAVFAGTTAYNFQPQLDPFSVKSVNGLRLGGPSTVALTLSAGSGTQTTNGATSSGSSTIALADVTGLEVGQNVTGSRIPLGTFITAIDVGTNTITISQPTSGGTLNNGTALTFNSSLALGDGGITLSNGTPNVANTITAPIVLGADQEWINDANRTLAVQGPIYLDSYQLTLTGTVGSTISFNGSSATQSITGSGSIVIDTDGTVSFGPGSGNRQVNTFTGGVTLNKGTLALQGGNSGSGADSFMLGTNVLTINGGRIVGGGNIAGHPLRISGQVWNADWEFGGGRSIDMGTGQISLGTAPGTSRTLTTNGGGFILTLGGAIVDGTTANTFIKEGASALLLTGTSTYTGGTYVNAGTLILNGALTGGGDVVVASGATLRGSGSITGNTFISGTHSPGNSPGIQNFENDLTYNAGAVFEFELTTNSSTQGSPTATFDQVTVGGGLDFAGATDFTMAFNLAGGTVDWSDSFWDSSQSWLVYDVTGTTTNFGNLSISVEDWTDNQGDFFNTVLSGATFSLSQVGDDVFLNYTAVPEPAIGSLLLGGVAAMAFFRRRRAG